jgi:PAS domain S-box-containing protein
MKAADLVASLGPRRWSSRRVAWAGGLFIAAIVALAVFDIVRGYRTTIERTARELESQARVLAEQTARSMQAVDVVLAQLVEQFESGRLASLTPEQLHQYLAEKAVGLVQIDALVVFDADGNVRAVSALPPGEMPPMNVAGLGPFAQVRATTGRRALVIDKPVINPANGNWVFPMGRPLRSASGQFAGAVGAPGRIEYFQQFYRAAYPDSATRIALLHENSTLLARHPSAEAQLGKRLPVVAELLAQSAAGRPFSRGASPIDGIDRFASVHAVPDYPLAIVVTRDAAVALGPWRAQALGSAVRTLALAVLAGLLIAVVMRQLRGLHAAQASLEISRERYALAAAGSDDGIWDWDLVGRTAYESARARELQGLSPGAETQPLEVLQGQLTCHPDDAARREQAMRAHLEGRTPAYEIEYRVRHPDGVYRWIRVRAECIRAPDGTPLRIAGSVSDVDARKRTEVALRESEERFALAVSGSDDGIWDIDHVTGQAFFSARGRQIMGLGDDEVLRADTWEDVIGQRIHPDDLARRQANLADHLAGRTPAFEIEYRVRRTEGGWRWVRARGECVRDAGGRPLRIAGSVSDIDVRKRAEEALRVSEERYALAMTGSRGGHWVWEVDTDKLFVSGTLNELFGLPAETGATTRSAYFANVTLHPDDAAHIADLSDDLVAGRAPRADFEYRIVLRDGTPRWILTRAQAFRSEDRGLRIAGVSVDISERKRTEEALRESEERFALAVEGSNDGIVDWDIAHDRLFISARALEILGIASDARVRPSGEWSALLPIHPDDRAQHDLDFRNVLKLQTGVRSGDYRMRQSDGSWRWVRVRGTAVRNDAGRAVRWAGSVTDIDVQKRTEEALRRSEERYQLAVDGSNEGLWDWDLTTDLLFLSPRAQRLTFLEQGEPLRPRDEWIARTVYHPDDVAPVRHAIAQHLHGATPHFAVEYRVQHHSGDWRWYRQRGVALRDASGRPYRMAGSMEDISARKNAEVERDRLEHQLRQAQKLEAIGTLAGGIAHDFNNILSAILGYGELAQKDAPEGTPLRRHVDAALSAGMRAKSLVERILAFSRSGMGERLPVHVQSVVGEALDVVAASMPAGVQLDTRLAAGDAGILGDPVQLHQVVLNLCANAVQAMKSGGVLAVTAEIVDVQTPLAVTTSTLPVGRYVRLVVRDTGSGIAPHLLERIFDPFFTTKEVGVGTGLGLSLVHGIVTDLGGGIAVDSRVGEGAVFTVWLPWHSEVAVSAGAVDEPVAGGTGETVLLVDDEEALVRLGEEMLAELGYEPVGLASSAAALDAFLADPDRFDAVLSDESMPGMTGSELVARIRAVRPDVPVVLMSGYVSAALTARARGLAVTEVLSKPLVARDMARCLAAALHERLHKSKG